MTRVIRERDAFELALTPRGPAPGPADPRYLPGPSGVKRCHRRNTDPGHPVSVTGAVDHDPERERWQPAHDGRGGLPGPRFGRSWGGTGCREQLPPSGGRRDLGQGLVVSGARAGDGVIEGIEMPEQPLRGRRAVAPRGVLGHEPASFQAALRGPLVSAAAPVRSRDALPARPRAAPGRRAAERPRSRCRDQVGEAVRRGAQEGAAPRASRCSWTSGPSGAAGATGWTRPPTSTPRWSGSARTDFVAVKVNTEGTRARGRRSRRATT